MKQQKYNPNLLVDSTSKSEESIIRTKVNATQIQSAKRTLSADGSSLSIPKNRPLQATSPREQSRWEDDGGAVRENRTQKENRTSQ